MSSLFTLTNSEVAPQREISVRLLLDDTWPLHRADGGGQSSFAHQVNDAIGGFFDVVWTPAEVRDLAQSLALRSLRPGDFCLVPFMSAACIYESLVELDMPGVLVLPLPLSRHPFWSLMPPCAGGAEVLQGYEALSFEFMNLLALIVESGVFSRMVFFDSNSATGRDFEMMRRLVDEMSGGRIESKFLLLCNETTAASLEDGPGHRGGRKTACPDGWAVRLKDSNVKYLSHLYLLLRFSAENWKRWPPRRLMNTRTCSRCGTTNAHASIPFIVTDRLGRAQVGRRGCVLPRAKNRSVRLTLIGTRWNHCVVA